MTRQELFSCNILYFTPSSEHRLNKFTWFTNWFYFHRLLQIQETSQKYQLSPPFKVKIPLPTIGLELYQRGGVTHKGKNIRRTLIAPKQVIRAKHALPICKEHFLCCIFKGKKCTLGQDVHIENFSSRRWTTVPAPWYSKLRNGVFYSWYQKHLSSWTE